MVNRIELLGLPCAGKSYYLSNSSFKDSEIGFADEQSYCKRLWICLFIAFRYPRITFYILKSFKYVERKYWKFHFTGVARYLSRIYDVVHRQADDFLLEEGVLQALWGVAFILKRSERSQKLIIKLFALIPEPAYSNVKYISVDRNTLVARNLQRPKKTRFSMLLQVDCGEIALSNSRYWMALILKLARSSSPISISYQTS